MCFSGVIGDAGGGVKGLDMTNTGDGETGCLVGLAAGDGDDGVRKHLVCFGDADDVTSDLFGMDDEEEEENLIRSLLEMQLSDDDEVESWLWLHNDLNMCTGDFGGVVCCITTV